MHSWLPPAWLHSDQAVFQVCAPSGVRRAIAHRNYQTPSEGPPRGCVGTQQWGDDCTRTKLESHHLCTNKVKETLAKHINTISEHLHDWAQFKTKWKFSSKLCCKKNFHDFFALVPKTKQSLLFPGDWLQFSKPVIWLDVWGNSVYKQGLNSQ